MSADIECRGPLEHRAYTADADTACARASATHDAVTRGVARISHLLGVLDAFGEPVAAVSVRGDRVTIELQSAPPQSMIGVEPIARAFVQGMFYEITWSGITLLWPSDPDDRPPSAPDDPAVSA